MQIIAFSKCCETKLWHIQWRKIEIRILKPKFSEKPRSEAKKNYVSLQKGTQIHEWTRSFIPTDGFHQNTARGNHKHCQTSNSEKCLLGRSWGHPVLNLKQSQSDRRPWVS